MSLADGVFPAADPGLSHGTYLAMAIVSSLAYFASIVLHELGHALEARREGVPTDRVTLWLFGGVVRRAVGQAPGADVSRVLATVMIGWEVAPVHEARLSPTWVRAAGEGCSHWVPNKSPRSRGRASS